MVNTIESPRLKSGPKVSPKRYSVQTNVPASISVTKASLAAEGGGSHGSADISGPWVIMLGGLEKALPT